MALWRARIQRSSSIGLGLALGTVPRLARCLMCAARRLKATDHVLLADCGPRHLKWRFGYWGNWWLFVWKIEKNLWIEWAALAAQKIVQIDLTMTQIDSLLILDKDLLYLGDLLLCNLLMMNFLLLFISFWRACTEGFRIFLLFEKPSSFVSLDEFILKCLGLFSLFLAYLVLWINLGSLSFCFY